MNDDVTVHPVRGNIFEQLGVPDAADERARVDLASVITLEIRRRGITQREAARLLKVSQPDVSAIMNARTDGFSQERLERMLNALDLDVRIQIAPRPAWRAHAAITVELLPSPF
jgi:predicted XRE-type DNA-binding protein